MTALFLKVFNMSVSAGWLVLAVLALRLALRRAPKWVAVLLWGMVALKLLCPVSIESALSLVPSAETVPQEIVFAARPAIQSGVGVVDAAINPVLTESFAPPTTVTSVNPIQIFLAVWANFWLLGALALALYALVSYWRLRRRVSTAVRLEGNVYQSEAVASPFILGLLRPRIYLPFSMDEGQRSYVLAHERAHLARRDHWWKPLGYALLCIHWFNPLLWLAYVLLCRDIELACDEKVVRDLESEERADYSEALLCAAVARRSIAACPLAFGEVGVKERVSSVLGYKKPAFWLVALSLVVCAVVAVCFLTDPQETLPTKDEVFLALEENAEYDGALLGCHVDELHEAWGEPDGFLNGLWGECWDVSEQDFLIVYFDADGRAEHVKRDRKTEFEKIVVSEDADLDHDGEAETVYVRELVEGMAYDLSVETADGTLLYRTETHSAHAGWNTILLYENDGEDYLVRYTPTMYQGVGNYSWTRFYLEKNAGDEAGTEVEVASSQVDFSLPLQLTDELSAFAEFTNWMLKNSTVLLSTEQGVPTVGPVPAVDVPQLFPVRFDPDAVSAEMEASEPFADGEAMHFLFASGAGGWGTTLTLYPDGSFEGVYEDSDMGSSGPGYPGGTRYICAFTGRFGERKALGGGLWSMPLEVLEYEEAGREWIEQEQLLIASEPYGLTGGEEFILCAPEAGIDALSEEFLWWSPDTMLHRDGTLATLGRWGLWNTAEDYGFFEYTPYVPNEP